MILCNEFFFFVMNVQHMMINSSGILLIKSNQSSCNTSGKKKEKLSCLPHRPKEEKSRSLFVSTCKLQLSRVICHSITSRQQWTDYNLEWAAQYECQKCRQQVRSQSELTYRQKGPFMLFSSAKMLNTHFFTDVLIARDADIDIVTHNPQLSRSCTHHVWLA